MSMIISGVLTVIVFLIVPVLIGMLANAFRRKKHFSIALFLISGYGVLFAFFELLVLPFIYLKLSFTLMVWVYSIPVALLSLFSLYLHRRILIEKLCGIPKVLKGLPWCAYLAAALILLQTLTAAVGMHVDDDDAFYVATATTTVETDTIFQYDAYTGLPYEELPSRYVLSPFPVWNAMMSTLTGLHPAIVAHTVMPVFYIPLAYAALFLLAFWLFEKNRVNAWLMIFFAALIQIFSFYSIYTGGTFLLVRVWQGKSFLANILIPAIFYFCIRTMNQRKTERTDWLLLAAMMGASCMVSSMGIMLAPIEVGVMGIVMYLMHRKLHILAYGAACCSINLICAAVYILIR